MDCMCTNRWPSFPELDRALAGADDVEQYLGGVFVIRVPRESIFILYLGGALHHCIHRRRDNGGVVFGRKIGRRRGPRLPVACCARRCHNGGLWYFHPSSLAIRRQHPVRASPLPERSWAASPCLKSPRLVRAISEGIKRALSPLSTNASLCRPPDPAVL